MHSYSTTHLPDQSAQRKVGGLCHNVCEAGFQVVALVSVFDTINADFGSAINFAHFGNNIGQFSLFILGEGLHSDLFQLTARIFREVGGIKD